MAILESHEAIASPPRLASVDGIQRARILRDEHGFIPTSPYETNEAFSLLSFSRRGGGAGRHLNEVLRHQTKARNKHIETAEYLSYTVGMEVVPLIDIDPEEAVRSITKRYVGFYKDAQNGFNEITDVAERVTETFNPRLLLAEEIPQRIGLGYIARYVALRQALGSADSDREVVAVPTDIDYFGSVFREPSELATSLIRDIDIKQARKLVPEAAQDQLARFEFWSDRLHEARMHLVARPLAESALAHYGNL